VRKIGNTRQQVPELFVERFGLLVESGDAIADFARLLLLFTGVNAGLE
jgi:hypothetical protein